jgi:hypothetical protein
MFEDRAVERALSGENTMIQNLRWINVHNLTTVESMSGE